MKRKLGITLVETVRRYAQTMYYRRSNIPVYRFQPLQLGSGFGGLLKGLLKAAMPMVKKGLLHVGKRVLNAGSNALQDVSENKASLKDALKNRALEQLHPANLINSGARKRKSTTPNKPSRRKVKKTQTNRSKVIAPSL